MKLLALDIGDVWTGTALSDAMGMLARPYQTIETKTLFSFLQNLFEKETIKAIIVGYPRTLRGTKSDQTRKTEEFKEALETAFPSKTFILWDERLSSQRAQSLKKGQTKEDKIKSHSIAAAFILENYLQFSQPLSEGE